MFSKIERTFECPVFRSYLEEVRRLENECGMDPFQFELVVTGRAPLAAVSSPVVVYNPSFFV